MNEDIKSQYDDFAEKFVEGTNIYNQVSKSAYYALLNFDISNKRVLDVGCGDGYDLAQLKERGAIIHGIDASSKLVTLAKKRIPDEKIIEGLMEELPYEDAFFDVVLSKYVLQTSKDVPLALREMDRVLKPKGTLVYLTVHPIRQFLEKRKHPKDYFLQEIVESTFFGGDVTASEPTHTMNEYFNPEFLSRFRILSYQELADQPSAESIDGDTYPCFFVLKAQKIES